MDSANSTIKAASWSRLKVFETCPQHAKLSYADKRQTPPDPSWDAFATRGTLIHGQAEKYIRSEVDELPKELSKPVIKGLLDGLRDSWTNHANIEVEQEWGFGKEWERIDWFDPDVWLRIKCDVVEHLYDGELIHVLDWKSGKRFGNEVSHSQQTLLYAVAIVMRYSKAARVRVTLAYTDEGKAYPREYSRETVLKMLPNFDQRLKKMTNATVFPAKPSKISCRFCPWRPVVSGGDGHCPWGVEV